MNERKNILIGKIGKAVKMKNIHIETGGGADLVLYSTMARMCPEYNFYFIGPNELHKCSEEEYDKLFPNHNVYSAWTVESRKNMDYQAIVDYFTKNNVTPDFAIVFVGMCSNVNIKGFLKKKDGTDYSPLICFQNYTAPILYALNKIGCPVYTLAEDAKYITINARDLYNRERIIFSQISGDFETNCLHITSEDDCKMEHMIKTTHHVKYAHIEKIFLMGLLDNWKDNIDFDAKFKSKVNPLIILSNGQGTGKINSSGNNASSRLPEYKKYIMDNFKGTKFENTMIYGNWPDEVMAEYPNIKNVSMFDLGEEVSGAKYTLVYSQIPGFVTCKPYEMLTFGLLPFIHPDYDCYHLLDFPEYLYVKDPEDFKNKINELESNPQKYIDLMNECFKLIKPEYLDGSFLVNGIFGNIAKDMGWNYEKQPGVKSIFNRFSKSMMQ